MPRKPKTFWQYDETALAQVRPEGWLRRYLEVQKEGLTGHLEVAGYPYDTKLWACKAIPMRSGEPWWPYEQTAYWVDGFTRCGYLLNDPTLIKKAEKQFNYVLKNRDRDGYLGPKSCKPFMHAGRWSHMIFFRAMLAHASATGDKRIIPALVKHYLSDSSDHGTHRDVCNIEILCNLYKMTGDTKLLTRAKKAWARYDKEGKDPDLTLKGLNSGKKANEHGVTFCETVKQPVMLYLCTGEKKYLKAAINGMKKLDKFQMLVDGAPSSSERLRSNKPLDAHETCDVADYSWTAGYFLMATGEVEYADKVERACLNAGLGIVTKDFKALQYFSCPNQVVASHNSCHTIQTAGGKWMSFRPKPGTECCTGEVNRIMPNYIARMWMEKEGNPVATLYGPSEYAFKVGRQAVTIVEETDFPYSDRIDFRIETAKPVDFTLHMRIPGWAKNATLTVNGELQKIKLKSGSFAALKRTFAPNDRVTLTLPMALKLIRTPENGVAVERGPLLYALAIPAKKSVDKNEEFQTKEFPAWNMLPAGDWNYALATDAKSLEKSVTVQHNPMTPEPWQQPPIELHVPMRKVKGWTLNRAKEIPEEAARRPDPNLFVWVHFMTTRKGNFVLTPALPKKKDLAKKLAKTVETVRLVPYGSTELRLTIFPYAGK